jgi:hypothetical protein
LHAHHLKAERCINHQKNEVCDFGNVDHGGQVIFALDNSKSPFFPANYCHRASDIIQCLLGISTDKGFDKGAFSNAWWANDGDYDWWGGIIGCTVNEGNMEASLSLLCCTTTLSLCSSA